MKWAAVLGLIGMILLAGCISPPPSPGADDNGTDTDDTADPISTAVINQVSLGSTTVYEGGSTNLILSIQNARKHPLDQVRATIGNRGNLQLVRQVPSQGSSPQHECRYDQIPGDTDSPVTRRCVWDISAPADVVGSARDEVTFPLTAFLAYSSSVSPEQNSLQVDFERQQDIAPGDTRTRSVRAVNEDLSVSLRHDSPVAAADGEVPITVTVRNIGEGTVVSGDQEGRGVTVMFGGTLADAEWNMQETSCTDTSLKRKAVFFQDGSQQAQISCTITLADGNLAGKTFFLRPRIEYRYRVSQDAPLRIVKRN